MRPRLLVLDMPVAMPKMYTHSELNTLGASSPHMKVHVKELISYYIVYICCEGSRLGTGYLECIDVYTILRKYMKSELKNVANIHN